MSATTTRRNTTQDVFTIIRHITAVLCGELSDAAANVTPDTIGERERFGALLKVCALMRAAMEHASTPNARHQKAQHAILRGIRDGLAQIDTSAQQTNHTARINATRKVTRYTRELLDFFEEEENS